MDASVASLLHEPWEIYKLAQAYDSAASDDPQPGPDPSKDVQRCIRDMMVLKVFLGGVDWTWNSFHCKMSAVFQRTMEQNLEAQVMQAACTIRRLGNDRAEFDRWLSGGQYGQQVADDIADSLFKVFNRCATASPKFHSRNGTRMKNKKPRPTRGRRRTKTVAEETVADETVESDEMVADESAADDETVANPLAWLGGILDAECGKIR